MPGPEVFIVKAQMLIRCPVSQVFAAFINPAVTTQFWFTRSSGRVEAGKQLCWDWEMYGVGTTVQVLAVESNRRILIEWDDPPCPVEWIFQPYGDDATLVEIANWGFHGNEQERIAQAIDAKGGFSLVLAGAKALLEHGIALNLVRDQVPPGGGQ